MPHQYRGTCSAAGHALGGAVSWHGLRRGRAFRGRAPQMLGPGAPATLQGRREPLTSRTHTGSTVIATVEQVLKVPLQIPHSVQDPRTSEHPRRGLNF